MTSYASKPLEKKVLLDKLKEKQGHPSVKLLGIADEKEMVRTIADAFVDDPMMRWFASLPESLPNQEVSMFSLISWITRGMNRKMLKQKTGAVFGVLEGTKLAGAMSVIPSSQEPVGKVGLMTYAIFGGGCPPYEITKKNYGKYTAARVDSIDIHRVKRIEHMKPYPGHIYLQQVGVRREYQGKGVGGKLFQMLFAAADSLQVPVYLEADSEENESLYHHYGFKTVETIILEADEDPSADAKFKMWLMTRLPK
eukprot:CAMPEP_0204612042 /NCGR_PEP_ID=MMETSP0717-20131115/146_1 /ASSEMBLY_ACC=CAM_ASM_000666 /TAXON_ID=230516 /ORGANISM="Chaetoceros curvisetus" /LENGTH=252 /DNA_ID=CAMNT_0051623955 /DNA_START=57 /DNA_END=815 /DNA_ORIENTATION=-